MRVSIKKEFQLAKQFAYQHEKKVISQAIRLTTRKRMASCCGLLIQNSITISKTIRLLAEKGNATCYRSGLLATFVNI